MNISKDCKISVLCATAPKPNPGMSSVDLAFYAFAKRHGFEKNVKFHQFVLSSELHAGKNSQLLSEIQRREQLPIQYELYRERLEDIYSSDVIIFWGDFTHLHRFVEIIARRLQKVDAKYSSKDAIDSVYQHLFFEQAPDDILKKTIIFGESLLFNGIQDVADERYRSAMKRLLSKSAGIFMRDTFSALDAQHLSGAYEKSHLGVDCSQLLHKEDISLLPTSKNLDLSTFKSNIGVFFGRSDGSMKDLGRLSRYLGKGLNADTSWIPWWYSRGSDKDFKKVKQGNRNLIRSNLNEAPLVGDLYSMLSNCQLVVTDTYHMALNSWKLGIPAICVGQGFSVNSDSVNSGPYLMQRDKRQIFYSMHQLSSFYSYAEEVSNARLTKKRVDHVISIIQSKNIVQQKVISIKAHAKSVETRLLDVISKLVN